MEFPKEKFKPKKDSRSQRRGGPIKFLYIACAKCNEPIMVYQKDGLGGLVRFYVDRIVWPPDLVKAQERLAVAGVKPAAPLACTTCGTIIGSPMVYEPEQRAAYRVVPGSMHAYRHLPESTQ